MSFVTMVKRCRKCRKKYIFDLDTGKGLKCPYCGHVPRNLMKQGRQIQPRDMIQIIKNSEKDIE